MQTEQQLKSMRSFYLSGKTRDLGVRKQALQKMLCFVESHQRAALEVLGEDLHKSPQEAYLTEMAMLLKEIKLHLKHLATWSAPQKVSTPVFLWPSKSRILSEPYGLVLIMSPWNYPLQLALVPLVGAIAAGNVAVIKCSPFAPKTAAWIEQLVKECFSDDYVACMYADSAETDYQLNQTLLAQSWDFIFYTGSTAMGKVVMRAAANFLTPMCLELGGKSPCIVDASANLAVAARRIVWGKLINAGQTCVAPDYICVHQSVKEAFVLQLISAIQNMYGSDIQSNPYYSRIIHVQGLERLKKLLQGQKIVWGGQTDPETRYMEPCLVDEPSWESPLMQEEIFGPVLPILSYDSLEHLCSDISLKEKPLALYVFANPQQSKYVLEHTTSGGACVNDVVLHLTNPNLPFGGVGHSGVGAYHGKYSFDCFSHQRSVLFSNSVIDIKLKYPPYKAFAWIKKAMK